MIGFLTGVATVLIFGQLGDLSGYQSEYSNKEMQVVDLYLHPSGIDMATTLIGLGTIALVLLLVPTRSERGNSYGFLNVTDRDIIWV